MKALNALELRLRSIVYRMPVPAYSALVALAVILFMAVYFGVVSAAEDESGSTGLPVVPLVTAGAMTAIFVWWGERKNRAQIPDVDERLGFDGVVLDPTSVGEGESLPPEWRKGLRDLADSKLMGFMPFILLAPFALITITAPATTGEAIWPSIVFVAMLFAFVAIAGAVTMHRGRNAELALGRTR